jgi:DNA-binding HxlR family transcriptional regulator
LQSRTANAGERFVKYNQFCPIAKSLELLGEKWTLLIIRELLMGSSKFGELQRGLANMSPALLAKRLKVMEEHNLIVRLKNRGERGHAYYPTEQTKELTPLLESLGVWGLRWLKSNQTDEDYDVEFLMLCLERSIVPEKLPGDQTVILFQFLDLAVHPKWWIVVQGNHMEVCVKDPGKDVDVFFTTKVGVMIDAWLGRRLYQNLIETEELHLIGPAHLIRSVPSWMIVCPLAELADGPSDNT